MIEKPECARTKCPNKVHRAGLCDKHYEVDLNRGYVDGSPARQHVQLLLDRGMTQCAIHEATGLTVWWLINNKGMIRRSTHKRVFAIPVPRALVSGGFVPAVGTVRRIQALAAIGYRISDLNQMLGRGRNCVEQWIKRDVVSSDTAADVADLYRQLSMTPGPSELSKRRALKRGWVPPLAWDDIDDRDEKPNQGDVVKVSFPDRYRELREHVGLSPGEIADHLGIKFESLQQQLSRYGISGGIAS